MSDTASEQAKLVLPSKPSSSSFNWEGLGIVGIILLVILVLVGSFLFYGKTAESGAAFSIVNGIFYAFSSFLAFGLISFGFIADIIGAELRYSIASIGSIIAMVVNYLLAGTISSFNPNVVTPGMASVSQSGTGWCSIPGAEYLESFLFPNAVVSTVTALFYYILSSIEAKRSSYDNIVMGSMSAVIVVGQLVALKLNGCIDAYNQFGFQSGLVSIIGALVMGVVFGASLFGIVKKIAPTKLPFYTFAGGLPPFMIRGNVNANIVKPKSDTETSSGGACQAIDGEADAFVCEAYKNGQLVTEQLA